MSKLRNFYLAFLVAAGIVLVIWAGLLAPWYEEPLVFFLLLLLAGASAITSTSLLTGEVTVGIGTAISLATVPFYGPMAAVLVAAAAELGLWIIAIRVKHPGWKPAAQRLGVNVGMNGIAIFLAGSVFELITAWLGTDTLWGQTVPWLVGALVGDQVNLWLLIVIIYLAHGVKPLTTWRENRWAVPINVLVMGVGGGLLALSVREVGPLGMAIYFLPIVISAYSFRLIDANNKKQMARLEELVAVRTQALADANKELADLHKDKDAFLAVLTHDMRTPLTSIRGYASILRDRVLAREQQVHIAKVVMRSQEALLEIVNNILEIEQLESGTPILLERSNFDLALLVKTAAESIEAQAMEKQISLQYEVVPTPVMVTADEKKIHRVLLNLISNAVKYTPEEGTVSIGTRVNGRYAIVEVTDTGYGIPGDELPFIFDRYRRVKGHRNIAIGTGLGLTIVKNLVEAHEGEITVVSEEDVGSTFTMKLPV